MGVVVNPTHISQFYLAEINFTSIIITARYESFSSIPNSLYLKVDFDAYSIAHVCWLRVGAGARLH